MKKLYAFMQKYALTAMSALALMTAVGATNRICYIVFHQPKQPKGMDKYRRHM